ncbi:inverse autotransporter beta domain-containing protein, partial [Thorsellia anophelis]
MLYIFNTNHGRTVANIALASQLFQFIFIPIASAVEQTNEHATATVSNYAQTQAVNGLEAWLNQYGNSRIKTHYDFDAEKFDDSLIDMLFALKDNGSDVTFTQFGYRHYDNRNTVNLGLGYRQLDEHYLWGVNAFYDRDLTGQNDRVSLGGEY